MAGRVSAGWLSGLVTAGLVTGLTAAQEPPTPAAVDLSLDSTAAVAGAVATGRDVLTLETSGSQWSVLHQLRDQLPAGTEINALTVVGDVVAFSVDTTVAVDSVVVGVGDVALYDATAESFSLLFDGSALGLPAGVGIDAVHLFPGWSSHVVMLFSIDAAATLGTTSFVASDVIRYDSLLDGFALEASGETMFAAGSAGMDVTGVASLPDDSLLLAVATATPAGAAAGSVTRLVRWDGASLGVYRDLGEAGLPVPGAGVDGVDVQYLPEQGETTVDPEVVSTMGLVSVFAVYRDLDNEPPSQMQMAVNGGPSGDMSRVLFCGDPYCNDQFTDGELYAALTYFPAAASSELQFRLGDGRDQVEPSPVPGPHHVSLPGDADGNGWRDAADAALILAEIHDDNLSASVGDVRTGHLVSTWGGADADHDNSIAADDLPAAVDWVY